MSYQFDLEQIRDEAKEFSRGGEIAQTCAFLAVAERLERLESVLYLMAERYAVAEGIISSPESEAAGDVEELEEAEASESPSFGESLSAHLEREA